ncbi:S-layer homology domain-containing protein [Bacillus sp. FJAT-28004]|uniref:S-layer homology domain-containing protein n=1 Tax=Bacillus sp. FJAT-28004 TaxID=1679165 RepID=UPI0006B5748D|nr:S-layer homology domain-containing protein [Bacillus sp. FJAT-28004]
MRTYSKKVAALLVAAALGSSTIPFAVMNVSAAPAVNAKVVAATSQLSNQEIEAAVKELAKLGVMQGYPDQSMGTLNRINRAELAKMIVKTFLLEDTTPNPVTLTDVSPNAWYEDYAAIVVGLGIMQAENGQFQPRTTVTAEELVQAVSKALKRDLKSVNAWASTFNSANNILTRGETAYLLQTARKAIPSDQAKITNVKSLNAITLIVTFDKPLTSTDEVFAKAKADFVFNDGLTLTNMPRLKTGSIATYIVPTSVQQEGITYNLAYKGQQAATFAGNATKVNMTTASQVTNDTLEVESLQANGVVDYGYIISAYSGGRGANAFILDENNQAGGKTFQIIPSMQARQVTITPEGGQPIIAKYVPFTQSTDGKQEPKFRLPEGQVLTPGVTYMVTSDWANIANATFVAKEIPTLQLTGAEAANDTSILVSLAEDPGDELFSGRSVELTAPNGEKIVASYKYSSRKGAVGVFDLTNDAKLTTGTTYTVKPIGAWATSSNVSLTLK